MQRTLGLIKPDAVAAGKVDEILAVIKQKGFRVASSKKMHLSEEKAKEFYAEHEGKPFFPNLIAFMTRCHPVRSNLTRKAVTSWPWPLNGKTQLRNGGS